MKTNPDTLVVTATLGNRGTLKRTIQSVQSIGGTRVKHIIIAPEPMCNKIHKAFPQTEVIPEPKNCKGIYPALNHALKTYAPRFKYLTFINDDDYWLNNYTELFSILDKDLTVDVAYGRVNYIDEKENIIGEQTSSSRYTAFKALLSEKIILFTQQSMLIRSELFLSIEGFDERFKLIADTKFWLKAIEDNSKFHYTKSICAAYTIQAGQLSSNATLQKQEHNLLNIRVNFLHAKLEKVLFRIVNIRIYLHRFWKYRNMTKMNKLFHSQTTKI